MYYNYIGPLSLYGYYGKGTGPVHMMNVTCVGNEDNLSQCTYTSGIGVDNCYHGKDVGVICTTGKLKLLLQFIM